MKKLEQAEKLNKTLGMIADQWALHPSKEWRRRWIKTAEEHSELPNAKLVLALANGKTPSLKVAERGEAS